jgi:hypothetical protein
MGIDMRTTCSSVVWRWSGGVDWARWLGPGVFLFEETARLGEAEEVSVDFKLVFAAVVGDRDDVSDGVAAFT